MSLLALVTKIFPTNKEGFEGGKYLSVSKIFKSKLAHLKAICISLFT